MVISDSPAFLFVHIPKTAGTSLMHTLSQGQPPHPLCARTKHETAASFIARTGEETFRRYFSFAVVRHPADRLLSHFAYLKSNPSQFPEMSTIATVEAYVDAIERSDTSIIRRPERAMEQWRFVSDAGDRICVDRIYRFEDLDAMLPDLSARLGVTFLPLPHRNVSNPAWKTASRRVDDFARRHYAMDFEAFGY